jgi:hypothetical protein
MNDTNPTGAYLQNKVKVLYIGGYLRIGSTLLDRMLGQCEGFVSVGELRRLWEESFAEDQPCGCGEPFSGCEFWRAVIEEAYGGLDQIDPADAAQLKQRVDRMRYIPQLMSPRKSRGYHEALTRYSGILERLYGAIREVSGSRVIIDSSKDPSYAHLLANVPNVDLHVVHLVRDSRAVAYSWLRKKVKHEAKNGSKVYMPRRGPVESSVGWSRANLLVEPTRLRGVGYLLIRYEDLLADPETVLQKIMTGLGEEGPDLPFLDGRTAELEAAHTVAGNPMRFRHGSIELRPDEEWRSGMAPADRRAVTAMTWPLLLRYGYLGRKPRTMLRTGRLGEHAPVR